MMKGKKASRARQICNLLDSPSLSGDERIGRLPFVISFAICPTLFFCSVVHGGKEKGRLTRIDHFSLRQENGHVISRRCLWAAAGRM